MHGFHVILNRLVCSVVIRASVVTAADQPVAVRTNGVATKQPDNFAEEPNNGSPPRANELLEIVGTSDAISSHGSLVRPLHPDLPALADLLATLQSLGGKIVRSGNGFAITGVAVELLPPSLSESLNAHKDELESLVPQAESNVVTADNDHIDWQQRYEAGEEIPAEIFFPMLRAALEEI